MIRDSLQYGLACLLSCLTLLLAGCDGNGPANAAPTNRLSQARTAPAIRVRVSEAAVKPLGGNIEVPGVVHPFQKATIAAEVPGRVIERLAEPGDRLEQGDPILRIDETDFALASQEAQIAVRAAAIDLADATRELERAKQLSTQKAISESEMDRRQAAFERASAAHARAEVMLAKTQRSLRDATVRAPFAGSVEDIQADVGEYLAPGARVATMVDFSRARIRAGITATEAAQLAQSKPAEIGFDNLGNSTTQAAVRSVARTANEGSGTYAVELWLEEPDPRLREGMIGTVHLKRRPGEKFPVVPRAAVLRRDGRAQIFVIEETPDGPRARQRPVRSGRTDGEFVEIVEGALPGELVVIDGHFALGEGSLVAVDSDQG